MWPWRKRSPFEKIGLPHKCFISHSFEDTAARERLLALLPKSVEPFIFPPITLPPEQTVSDKLLDAIRGCEGLIYVHGGASARSFWVALERDYAMRAGKRVFSFSPDESTLAQDTSAPLQLSIFPVWSQGDTQRVLNIIDFMKEQRFFTPWRL